MLRIALSNGTVSRRMRSGRRACPLEISSNYSATSNNMKLVHWTLVGGLLYLVQRGGDWAGLQPAQDPPRCTKCNSPPGMSSATDRARLDSMLRRSKRLGYCNNDLPPIADLFNSADDDFFHRIKTNSNHVLRQYLPDKINLPYTSSEPAHTT